MLEDAINVLKQEEQDEEYQLGDTDEKIDKDEKTLNHVGENT